MKQKISRHAPALLKSLVPFRAIRQQCPGVPRRCTSLPPDQIAYPAYKRVRLQSCIQPASQKLRYLVYKIGAKPELSHAPVLRPLLKVERAHHQARTPGQQRQLVLLVLGIIDEQHTKRLTTVGKSRALTGLRRASFARQTVGAHAAWRHSTRDVLPKLLRNADRQDCIYYCRD
jgi:hypothetical protein